MAEEQRPEHMSEQDWTNFQTRYRPKPTLTPGAPPNAAPEGAQPLAGPGQPGQVAPALKNPAPSPQTQLQPSAAPQIGDGGGGARMVTAPGLLAEGGQGQQPSAPPQQTPQQQMQGMLRTSIMGMLGQDVNAASASDADIRPQSEAFANAANRAAAQRRASTVHQASRGGWGDSGALDGRLDSIAADTGAAIGANDAQLVGQKLETRRAQLNNAMQLAQQAGLTDEANQLQREIANLGARVESRGQDISREGLQLQNNLANLDASTRIYLGDLNARMQQEGVSAQERMARMDAELRRHGIDVQGNLGLLDTVLRGQLGNRQIDLGYDQLGVDVADIRRQMNRDAVIGGLQG